MTMPIKKTKTYAACIHVYKAGRMPLPELIIYFKCPGIMLCRATMHAHNLIDRGYLVLCDGNVVMVSDEIRNNFDSMIDLDENLPICERAIDGLVEPAYHPKFKEWTGKANITYPGREERSTHTSGTSAVRFRGAQI